MLAVKFVLVAFGITLVKANFGIGKDGEPCNPFATLCTLDNELRHMDTLMSHAMQQLSHLGEFEESMKKQVELLTKELNDLKNQRSQNLVLSDESSEPKSSDAIKENVNSLLNVELSRENMIKKLSNEVSMLQSEKNQLKVDLESEKKSRRSLNEKLKYLDEEVKQTKSLKPVVEEIQIKLHNFSEPDWQNMTVHLALLMEDRNIIKSEMENEKNMLKNLEAHLYLLETELNKTNNVKVNMDDLHGKMDQLKSNITNDTVDKFSQIIDAKLSYLEQSDNEKMMEEKLKTLEYHLVNKQNNVSILINDTLNSRVSVLEQLMSTLSSQHINNSQQLTELLNLEISIMRDHLNQSIDGMANEMLQMKDELENLKESTSAINLTIFNHQSHSLEELSEILSNQMHLTNQISNLNDSQLIMESEFKKLDRKIESQREQIEIFNSSLANLFETYQNISSNQWQLLWNNSQTTVDDISALKLNYSQLNEKLWDVNYQTEQELIILQEELDQLKVTVVNLDHDWDRNITNVNSKLKKIESVLGKMISKDDFNQHDEKIVQLYVNVSKLRGLTEDFNRKLDTWNAKLVEVKNWIAEYVDREYKKLEKHINRAKDHLMQKFNHSIVERIEETKEEIKKITDRHEELISYLLNNSNFDSENQFDNISSVSNSSSSDDFCVPILNWDPNLVVSYNSRPYTPQIKSIIGGEELLFRCSHIGRYVLIGPRSVTCLEGQWSSDPPICKKLADEKDIDDSRNVPDYCHSAGNGHHLFPLDCKSYYNCMEQTFRIQSCPLGLLFDNSSRKCVHSELSDCDDRPSIDIHPLPGTSNIPIGITEDGTLVVFPGQNLILSCIYPLESGPIKWEIKTKDVVKTHRATIYGDKQNRLELKHVNESNSGNYSCVISEKRRHSINIQVKMVMCPDITVESPLNIVNEITQKLSSKVIFSCLENYTLVGSSFIVCLANGQWSDKIPTCELKGCPRPDTLEDAWINLSPDLPFYPANTKLLLSCKQGAPATKIPAVIRCLPEGVWNIFPFPTCLK